MVWITVVREYDDSSTTPVRASTFVIINVRIPAKTTPPKQPIQDVRVFVLGPFTISNVIIIVYAHMPTDHK